MQPTVFKRLEVRFRERLVLRRTNHENRDDLGGLEIGGGEGYVAGIKREVIRWSRATTVRVLISRERPLCAQTGRLLIGCHRYDLVFMDDRFSTTSRKFAYWSRQRGVQAFGTTAFAYSTHSAIGDRNFVGEVSFQVVAEFLDIGSGANSRNRVQDAKETDPCAYPASPSIRSALAIRCTSPNFHT